MRRPNVILICCDDLGFNELGVYHGRAMPDREAYGRVRALTPRIDSLAREGALLTRFYATSPICTPSRYSIVTGRYASRSPSLMEKFPPPSQVCIGWNAEVRKEEATIGKAFQAMGYATGFVGKWHNGDVGMDFAAVKDCEDPRDPAAEKAVRAAYQKGVAHLRDGLGFDYVARVCFGNRERLPKGYHVHNLEWLAEGACDFIDQETARPDNDRKPFFLYFATSAPHGNHGSAGLEDPLVTPAGILDKAPDIMPPRETLRERCRAAGLPDRAAMSLWIDDCVGAILDRLEAAGVAGDTIVAFTVDHLARGKYMCYEGARVPFLIRAPGRIPAGIESDALCANIDLAATLTDLAGGALPENYPTDGRSFASLLTAPELDHAWRERLLLEVSNIRGLVTPKWKYIANRGSQEVLDALETDRIEAGEQGRKRWVSWDGKRNPHSGYEKEGVRYFNAGVFPNYFDPDQMYDLENDVFERENLATDPRYAETLASLQLQLGEELARLPHGFGEWAVRA